MNLMNRALLVGRFHLIPPDLEIECGDGWFDILRELFDKLTALNAAGLRILQIKQKFGYLVVYVEHSVNDKREESDHLFTMACAQSFETCELCGAPGIIRFDGGVQVRCVQCQIKSSSPK